jgi:ABC-type polysaccharide/polyol phosphate transport system ATPase subunit
MNESAVIRLSNVGKKYYLHKEKPTLVETLFVPRRMSTLWALKNISLSIGRGERVGVVGANGSGKTTLIRIITGITTPTVGEVYTRGRVVSLIELEAGFHPDLTGAENIYPNGLIMGMTKTEIARRVPGIVAFADIGKFIYSPIYTYSEGMKLRLGFSVAVAADPDVLVLDENVAAGDQNFQQKSLNKIREFYRKKKTVIIASHYSSFLRSCCDRIVWLQKGRIVQDGPARRVLDAYKKFGT